MGSFPAGAMPLEAVNAAFLHYNPLQQLATATTRGGMDTDMAARSDVQMMPQRKENNPSVSSIPEVYLDSSYFPVSSCTLRRLCIYLFTVLIMWLMKASGELIAAGARLGN